MIQWWKSLTIQEKRLVYFGFLLCLVFFIFEHINGRNDFWDFRVYFGAAEDLLAGNSPYEHFYGVDSGFYKYSPVVLIFFIPLTFLPYSIASGLFYFLITFGIIYLLIEIHRHLKNKIHLEVKWQYIPLYLLGVLMIAHLGRELHLGNVNLLLLLLFFIAYRLSQNQKKWLAGSLIALGILIKPHFIILIPLFVLKAEWKLLIALFGGLMVLCLAPVIFLGWDFNAFLLESWLETMVKHNESLLESPNTVYGLINTLLGFFGASLKERFIVIVLGLAAAGIFLIVMRNKIFKSVDSYPVGEYLEYFLLIALIPNLTHTDTEHFLWSLPILALCLYFILSNSNKKKKWLGLFIIVLIALPWYLNTPDILGQKGAEMMDKGGWIGLSNLLIIGITIFYFFKRPRIAKA